MANTTKPRMFMPSTSCPTFRQGTHGGGRGDTQAIRLATESLSWPH
jgi:hypothetical protein